MRTFLQTFLHYIRVFFAVQMKQSQRNYGLAFVAIKERESVAYMPQITLQKVSKAN